MREIEVVVLDGYGCYLAKKEVRDMFRYLDDVRKGLASKGIVLDAFRSPPFRDFLLEAAPYELIKYFDEKELEIIEAYRELNRGVTEEELERLKSFFKSIDDETFFNFLLKLVKLRISWGCLRNLELGEKIFEKELKKIAEYFERWKRGEIDYKRFRDRTAKWRRRIDDKVEDLFGIVWRKEIEEEERAFRRAARGVEE